MAITRPTGEQLRFRSQYTGDHILDTYLEAAEKGGRTLADLLDDLFDGSGVFRSENFEFRFEQDKLQFRAGVYANPSAGWQDVTTFFNITGTFNASTTYNNFDLVTLSTKDVYIVHDLTAPTTFSSEAALISSANTEKLVDVSEARDWASKTTGQVQSTDYSAKAYAVGGTGIDTTTGSAKDWAIKTSGTVGNTSEYSAKYWATSPSITTVASGISNINAVAADISNVNAVGSNITNVNTTAGIAANITAVANIQADVTTTANINANITTVANISTNVTSVANNQADVSTVATEINNNNLQTVANDIQAIITAADDLNEATSEIETVANSITNVDAVGNNITSVNTVADNLTDINSFANTYLGPYSTAPTQDPDGSALDLGDLYFNTTDDALKVYTASGWVDVASSVNGTANRFAFTATQNQTTFSGADDDNNTLAYDAGFVDVYMNGVKLVDGSDFTASNGTSIVLPTGADLDDVIYIVAYGTFSLANISIGDLTDVNLTGLANESVLVYNSTTSRFEPGTGITGSQISLGDNEKILLGDDDDLEIFHSGSHSFIKDTGTGNLYIDTDGNAIYLRVDTNQIALEARNGAGVKLRHANSPRLETTSAGVDVTGSLLRVTSAGEAKLTIEGDSNNDAGEEAALLSITSDGGAVGHSIGIEQGTDNDLVIAAGQSSASHISSGISFKTKTTGTTTPVEYLNINSAGLLSTFGPAIFNEGASAFDFRVESANNANMLFVDGSANAVGIGTNIPAYGLEVVKGASTVARIRNSAATGATPSTTHGELVIESTDANMGMQFLGSTTSNQRILFGDTDAGGSGQVVYDHTSDYMRFDANNAERLRITSSGFVGIGTTGPLGDLHVKSGASGANTPSSEAHELVLESAGNGGLTIATENTSGIGSIFFANSDSNAAGRIRYYNSSDFMTFNTNGTERLRLSTNTMWLNASQNDTDFRLDYLSNTYAIFMRGSDGKVAMGHNLPQGQLHVQSGSTGGTSINGSADDLVVESNTSGGITILTPDSLNGNIMFAHPTDNNIGSIVYQHGADTMTFTANNTEFMRGYGNIVVFNEFDNNIDFRIESTANTHAFFLNADSDSGQGRIGIRTSNPSGPFDVRADTDSRAYLSNIGKLSIESSGGGNILTLAHTDSALTDTTAASYIAFSHSPSIGGSLTRMGYFGYGDPGGTQFNWHNEINSAQSRIYTRDSSGNNIQHLRLSENEINFNVDQNDVNFRVEAVNSSNAFFVDGFSARVGIGTNLPAATFDARGNNNSRFRFLQDGKLYLEGGQGGDLLTLAHIGASSATAASSYISFGYGSSLNNFTRMGYFGYGSTSGTTWNWVNDVSGAETRIYTHDSSANSVQHLRLAESEINFNVDGAALNFRVESAPNANALFVDATNSRVGINNGSPTEALDVLGNARLVSEDATSTAEPVLTLYRNSATPADGDYLGQIKFQGESDTGVTRVYAKITAKTSDVTNLTEDGLIETSIRKAGANTIVARQTHDCLKLINGTGLEVAADAKITGGIGDSSGSLGSSGQVLSSTGTGTAWTTPSSGITGTGSNDRIAVWTGSSGLDFDNNFTWNGTTLTVGTTSGSPLSTRAFISYGGDVNSPTAGLVFRATFTGNSGQEGKAVVFYNQAGSEVGKITHTQGSTTYSTSSDYRIKDNVVALSGAIERVKQLKPKRFNFTATPTVTVDGFLAHEAQAVVPEAITGVKDAVYADGSPDLQGIDQSKLVPLLTAALQEAITKIESLEARITALEAN